MDNEPFHGYQSTDVSVYRSRADRSTAFHLVLNWRENVYIFAIYIIIILNTLGTFQIIDNEIERETQETGIFRDIERETRIFRDTERETGIFRDTERETGIFKEIKGKEEDQ